MTLIAQYILPLLLLVSAISDIKTRRIPNWISATLMAGFMMFSLTAGLTIPEFAIHMGIGLCVLICGFILFGFNIIGGGDAKLLAASAIWMGPAATISFIGYTAIAGGLFSVIILVFRKSPLPVAAHKVEWVDRLHAAGEGIPYGVAIATGGLMALLLTEGHQYTIY